VNANSSLPDAYAKRPRQQSGPIMKTIILTQDLLTAAALGYAMALTPAHGADAPKMKMTTETPASITTPDEVKTRLGTLKFTDGFSDQATAQACYDNLDFQHAVQAYLAGLPAVSVEGIRQGLSGLGPPDRLHFRNASRLQIAVPDSPLLSYGNRAAQCARIRIQRITSAIRTKYTP
jgi:hypothetical protein